jgi:predicted nucleic acid-binding protein
VDRLFLDANILFSASYGPESPLRRLWQLDEAELLTSAYALAEAQRNLETKEQQERLETLLVPVRVVGESEKRDLPAGVTLREKDVPILCSAIEARASHLLTLDLRDFGPYLGKSVAGVLVLHPRDYRPSKGGQSARVKDGLKRRKAAKR